MKLPNFLLYEPLNQLRDMMGIPREFPANSDETEPWGQATTSDSTEPVAVMRDVIATAARDPELDKDIPTNDTIGVAAPALDARRSDQTSSKEP